MGEMTRPHRAHELDLRVGADSAKELACSLRHIADRVERDDLSRGCSGGPSSGWTYEYRHDPEMTHERYFAEVDAYLARDDEPKAMTQEVEG